MESKSTAHLSVWGLGLPGPGTLAATTQAHMGLPSRGGPLHPTQGHHRPYCVHWGL